MSDNKENKIIPYNILPLFTVKLFKTFLYVLLFQSTFFQLSRFSLHYGRQQQCLLNNFFQAGLANIFLGIDGILFLGRQSLESLGWILD